MKDKHSVDVHCRLTVDDAAALDSLADRQGRTRSNMLTFLIKRGLGENVTNDLAARKAAAPEVKTLHGPGDWPLKEVKSTLKREDLE